MIYDPYLFFYIDGERVDPGMHAIQSGSITVSKGRTASVEIVDPKRTLATLLRDISQVNQTEALLFIVEDGVRSSIAKLAIDSVSRAGSQTNTSIELALTDPSVVFNRKGRSTPYTVRKDTERILAFTELIQSVDPSIAVVPEDIEGVIENTVTYDIDSDPWDDALEMAKSFGAIAFFDRFGNCRLQDTSLAKQQPSKFYYSDRNATGFKPFIDASIEEDLNTRDVVNGVKVRGEAPWLLFPVNATVWDSDPGSETYYNPADPVASRFGPRPIVVGSSGVGSVASATKLAEKLLEKEVNTFKEYSFTVPLEAAIEQETTLFIRSDSIDFTGKVIVDTARHDLLKYTTTITARAA